MNEGEIIKENNKTNKAFMILSVFGIIFVVLGHYNYVTIFMNNVFPFYSFHMPLFAFISGYFFKDRKVGEFFKVKIKKLIIPYFIWNIVYGIIVNVLKYFNIVNYGKEFSLFNIFIAPFYGMSNQFYFNIAAWFVISIFFVQLIYFLIYKVNSKLKINTEIPVMIISIVIAILDLNFIKTDNNSLSLYLLERIGFLMPFYAIGQVYKRVEKYEIKNNAIYLGIILVIQCLIANKYELTYNVNTLSFKNNFLVYLLGSMTGILFWLRISKILSKYIESKWIEDIGNNTYGIMMHHVFIFFIMNSFIGIINKLTGLFGKFNFTQYKNNTFYSYSANSPAMTLIFIAISIAVPIYMKKIYVILKAKIKIYWHSKKINDINIITKKWRDKK